MLSKMYWKSEKNNIVNTTQEAIEHGGNGGNGFYISGDGQFMGFFYPDEMKSEKGEVDSHSSMTKVKRSLGRRTSL